MKFTYMTRVVMLSTVLAALVATGCGQVKDAAVRTRRSNELKQIGLLYQNYFNTYNKPPANADDLLTFARSDPQAAQAVQQAKSGTFVILWDANLREMQQVPGGALAQSWGMRKTSQGLVVRC